ncbi:MULTISPECIES: GNAT family N-acetyltransferase [unclassified Neorhizobium]|uniref:GNAT family N-acetyltransferase n=1 Tax=unclassified Neorhizobium TaxID=2629175 RepID=UPI001FF33C50|nr:MULTISPECIES: GNAT family N-acetyltransferase [unclassified Neorhizobium]MCJ9672044.1 GNAT family N-acetyltransferase [Neorhizobium sp. SHOUNA12B]MCJ9746325.1 GNAT family N-acetyltransferase [Neorhizobium sp. SHOUNA12A]
MVNVRQAKTTDIPAMSRVLTASITFLCTDDHGNDLGRLSQWTKNKTEAGVGQMMDNPHQTLWIAEVDGEIAAVGAVTDDSIVLNYVAPEHRFQGVSKALLAAMEDTLRNAGISLGRLVSTRTALRFYLACGWSDLGPGAGGILMEKVL